MDDLAGFGKAAEKALSLLGDTCGVLYEPTRIKKKAKADAEAIKVLAEANGECASIEIRAKARADLVTIREQQNLESIVGMTLKQLEDVPDKDISSKSVDPDWMHKFITEASTVSDNDIQTLWSRVLAGEIRSPGKFSRRSLTLISNLSSDEAEMFTNLISCSVLLGDSWVAFVYSKAEKFYNKRGLDYQTLSYLDSLGLIVYTNLHYNHYRVNISSELGHLANTHNGVLFRTEVNQCARDKLHLNLNIGSVLMTPLGKEMASLVDCKPDLGLYDLIWKNNEDNVDIKHMDYHLVDS